MSEDWEARFEQFIAGTFGDEAGGSAAPDPAHDLAHIRRVVASARLLAAGEGADPAVVLPAAWLHDCVRLPKDSPDRSTASQLAARRAGEFLREAGYSPDLIPAIEHAIAAHSFSAGIAPQTLEARVVQDADRLDALGAIGIARTLMLGGVMNMPLYDPDEPLPISRTADDGKNVIDHFYVKLLTLTDRMHTAAARREGRRRTRLMEQFLTELEREISAKTFAAEAVPLRPGET